MRKRFFKKRDKGLPKGYDSKLELRLHQGALREAQHHVPKEDLIPYSIDHTYEPDYVIEHGGTMYVIETKGRFRDSAEAAKYVWVRKHLNDWHCFKDSACTDIELLILFENASTAMPFAKARKDGTKLNHGGWATKNKFRWLCEKADNISDVESFDELIKLFNVSGGE